MCINLGGSGDGLKPIKKGSDEWNQIFNPPEIKDTKPTIEELSQGPNPTVVAPTKSSLALSSRRRKLIDAFKYGLSGQLGSKTNAPANTDTIIKKPDTRKRGERIIQQNENPETTPGRSRRGYVLPETVTNKTATGRADIRGHTGGQDVI
jgi:hypothetical protein